MKLVEPAQNGGNLKAVGIIPSRWGSTRLPGKSLLPLGGKPLVQWVVEGARRAERLSDVVVATDDERIRRAVEGFGGRVVMTRADHPSGTDRVAEVAALLGADLVVNIQGDEPLIDPELIDALVERMYADPSLDMATAATSIRDTADLAKPSVVKVVWDADGVALYFSRSPIPYVRDARDVSADETLHWRHVGIYAYRRAFLDRLVRTSPCLLERAEKLEQLRALHLGGRIAVLRTEHAGIGVDTPADVPYAEALIKERFGKTT